VRRGSRQVLHGHGAAAAMAGGIVDQEPVPVVMRPIQYLAVILKS
jgi:hypothetical protein